MPNKADPLDAFCAADRQRWADIGEASVKRRGRPQCGYCGAAATTRDHVPTKKLFPVPRPGNLITIPCCTRCNNELSLEEEYLIHVLLSHREADTPVARVLRDQLFDRERTARRKRMARRMLAAMYQTPVTTPAGLYLGHASALHIDRKGFDRVVEKITRGLYFATFSERVPSEQIAQVTLSPLPEVFEDVAMKQIIDEGAGGSIGDKAFAYRIARAQEPPGVAMCVRVFFDAIWVICSLLRRL